jgi:hypothetical protein
LVCEAGRLAVSALVQEVATLNANYYIASNHEAASKFVDQKCFAAKYSAAGGV